MKKSSENTAGTYAYFSASKTNPAGCSTAAKFRCTVNKTASTRTFALSHLRTIPSYKSKNYTSEPVWRRPKKSEAMNPARTRAYYQIHLIIKQTGSLFDVQISNFIVAYENFRFHRHRYVVAAENAYPMKRHHGINVILVNQNLTQDSLNRYLLLLSHCYVHSA